MKQIARAEKEAEKLLDSYLETSGALKIALAEKYEKQIEKLETLKLQIKEDTDEESDKRELIQRIKEIQNRMDQMKEIRELDRDIVLRFINRIEIDKSGKIEVFLNTEALYKSQINAWKERKQSSGKKAAFLMCKNKVSYSYDIQFYTSVIDRMCATNIILLFKFQYKFKEIKKRHRSTSSFFGRKEMRIDVWVSIA